MAYVQRIYNWAFLLAVIVCHVILFTEGRQLKSLRKQELSIKEEREVGKLESRAINTHQSPAGSKNDPKVTPAGHVLNPSFDHSVADKNAFRPTTPGGSPGIGHSFARLKDDIKTKKINTGASTTHGIAGNTDDFRPTAPGLSPGTGHSIPNKDAGPNA